jgi:crotonobetainyl-CoA:carnitine CoA-transferase CaiB-like acyl-CoA transferase
MNEEVSSQMPGTTGPLSGVRVMDFTHTMAGPFCTQYLADAGADVIKVEPPLGEHARVRGPRRTNAAGEWISSFNAAVNRGKRSVALDLKNPCGVRTALRLLETADVAVENLAPGTMTRLGIDFAALRSERPTLITASISLFGSADTAGDLTARGGLAIVAEGESGLLRKNVDERNGGDPHMFGLPLGDLATGVVSYGAIVTALFERTRTGLGRHLDISMVRSLLSLNSAGITSDQITPDGSQKAKPAGYGIYRTADGYVTIGVNSDSLFARLVGAMGRPEMALDPRYAAYKVRDASAQSIDEMIGEWTKPQLTSEIVARVAAAGVPVGRVTTSDDLLSDESLRALSFFESVDDGIGSLIDTPANPMGFSRGSYRLPRIGEDARAVLSEIGVAEDDYDRLAADGAFGSSR